MAFSMAFSMPPLLRSGFLRRGLAAGAAPSKGLEGIMHVAKVRELDAEQIEHVWNDFHREKGMPSAVMGAHEWNSMQQRAKACPNFVVPVPTNAQKEGFQAFFVQWQIPHALFTGADEYRILGAASKPLYTVTHYTELLAEKGVVLARGEPAAASGVVNSAGQPVTSVTPEQGRHLFARLHAFYAPGTANERRWALVEQFNHAAPDFRFERLLEECKGLPAP